VANSWCLAYTLAITCIMQVIDLQIKKGLHMRETAVFIHSTGMGPFMWKRLMAGLPEGMQAVAPVNRGYAPDDLWERGQAFDIAQDLAHVRSQIPPDATGLHLIAHSYGGLLAMTLALDPTLPVKSLWLYEPVMFGSMKLMVDELPEDAARQVRDLYDSNALLGNEDEGGKDAWLQHFIDYWSQAGAWAASPDKVKQASRAVGWKMFKEVNAQAMLFRPVSDYQFKVPLTLVHGGHSPAPAGEMVRQLARVNPHAVVNTLSDLSHMSVVTQSDQVLPSLQGHWQRL
jgi:pimeloyl-ACP methyl ester carboxylesterase